MYIREVAAFPSWGSCHLGNYFLGKCTFGKLPIFLHGVGATLEVVIWEVAAWENCTFGKLPLEKIPLAFGTYLTSNEQLGIQLYKRTARNTTVYINS